MLRRSRPLLCSIATGISFGAQQPTGRTAWVGWTASAMITSSLMAGWLVFILLDECCLFLRVQLARDHFRLAVFHAQAVQQSDQPGPGVVFNAALTRDPRANLAGRARQGFTDPGFQLVMLLRCQPAGVSFMAKARQPLDPVFL